MAQAEGDETVGEERVHQWEPHLIYLLLSEQCLHRSHQPVAQPLVGAQRRNRIGAQQHMALYPKLLKTRK